MKNRGNGCWNHKKITEQRCRLNDFAEDVDSLAETALADIYPMMIFPSNKLRNSEMKKKFSENQQFQKATESLRGKIG